MSQQYYISQYDYEPTEKDELVLHVNDIVLLIKEIEEGWYYGENIETKKKGAFPSNYVVKHDYQPQPENTTQTENQPQSVTETSSGLLDPKAFMQQTKPQVVNQMNNIPKSQIVKEGWLTKKGEKFKNWKKRYFKLYPRSLKYFKLPQDFMPLGTVLLPKAVIEKSPKKRQKGLFFIRTPTRVWQFKAESETDRQGWYVAISSQISILDEETKKIQQLNSSTNKTQTETTNFNSQNNIPKNNTIQTNKPKPQLKGQNNSKLARKLPPTPNKKKPTNNNQTKVFGTSLKIIFQRNKDQIPKILLQTTQYLEEKGLIDSELFISKGNLNAINAYKLKYDRGLPVNFENEKNPKNVSNLLMEWIIKIPESFIPKQLISQFIETTNQNESKEKIMEIKQLIEQLPLEQFKILENIIGFIKKLINQDQSLILNIFSSILFFKKRFDLENGNENKNYVELLQIFMNFYDYLFLNEELEWEEDNESSNDSNDINNEQYEVEENEKSVIKTSKGYVELFKAVALYDFVPDGESPDDLPIQKEEVLSIVSTEDSDWWYGSIVLDSNGKQIDEKYGYFPSNYVKKISEEDWQQISNNI
ncbi:rho gtpase-activating protein 68f [Anaeramoeba flamelloides]|uniref:Rho gtpase-activating protein 68f n=1 Tax=Anaeramoeba flamelloides TaxID=1746091 RepID=A0AAV8AD35_9EUKA|nr:rho gtpase-activating protein 68f [Anaeramoeba flamelloides]KAJ6226356.1 rho gtpase-activating protein 68f [Anaeramoeba flamelloides]